MGTDFILSIVGAFGVLALGVNGFFLRGIFQDLNAVRVQLAELSTRGEAKEKRIEDLERNERDIYHIINKNRERLHTLEGGQAQMMQYLKEN